MARLADARQITFLQVAAGRAETDDLDAGTDQSTQQGRLRARVAGELEAYAARAPVQRRDAAVSGEQGFERAPVAVEFQRQRAAVQRSAGQCAMFDEAPAVEHQHMGRVLFEFAEDVRGHEQRHAVGLQRAEECGKLVARRRVQARGGFVEHQHAWRVDDCLRDGDPLAESARQRAGAFLQPIGQAEPGRGVVYPPVETATYAVRGGRVMQAARDAEVVVQPEEIRQVTEALVAASRFVDDVDAVDDHAAGERPLESAQAAHQRRLARAVGTDQRRDAAGIDAEAEIVEGTHAGIVEGEFADVDHGPHCACSGAQRVATPRGPRLTSPDAAGTLAPMKPRPESPCAKATRCGLARALSKRGYCSRTAAAALIAAGRVSVDGRVERNPEAPTTAESRIAVDGVALATVRLTYLMLNKPRGLVTTTADEHARDTVYRCLRGADLPWLAPVGRLDKASEGLLLMTNDTGWAARITDSAGGVEKTYHVQIDTVPDAALIAALRAGVVLEDGARLGVASARVLRAGERHGWLEVALHEGRNRHLRRLLGALGVDVLRLVRVAIGGLLLGDLAKGAWRVLSADEVRRLGGTRQAPGS